MSQFQYYFPGVSSVARETIKELGLSTIISTVGGRGVINGPDKGSGAIVSEDMSVAGYFPDKQNWVPAPKRGAEKPPYWIGWDKEEPPTPEDLVREDTHRGITLKDANGKSWIVPQIRNWHEDPGSDIKASWSTSLPMLVDIDDEGNPVSGQVVAQHRDIFDDSLNIFVALLSRGENSLTEPQMIHFVSAALMLNYRVTLLELSSKVLGAMSGDFAQDAMLIAIDWKGYEDALKNADGRPTPENIDTESGVDRPMQEEKEETIAQL